MNKELQEIIEHFERLESSATKTVLATVVDVKGSSYRLPGARMLIGENGEMFGTVSGGCLEADVLERARQVLQTGAAQIFTYDTTAQEDSVFSLNMGCRGVIRILLERPNRQLIDFFRDLYKTHESGLVATLIESTAEKGCKIGQRLLLNGENWARSDFRTEIRAKILPDCLVALREKRSKYLLTEYGEFFLEFIAPPISLIIFGAGFDAVPVFQTAKTLGWRVTIVDHRAAFANKERFPKADEIIITRPENLAERISIDENTVAVTMTHNYEFDKRILGFLLNSDARYIGALGPKRRMESILTEMREAGDNFSSQQLNKLYAPIGLDIGADTPESIALSIIAEIKSVLADRAGSFLRERKAQSITAMSPFKPKVGLIILAAGSSTRMNGQAKQLLVFQGKTLLRRAAETALQADFKNVVVVFGANAERFFNEIVDLQLEVVVNKDWQAGMNSSIKTGITALSKKNLDAAIIMLCDQPLITTKTLQQLSQIFVQSGKQIVACKYEETIGVPALFSSQFFPELMNLKGFGGAKELINKYLKDTTLISTFEAGIDIDTVEDYEKLKQLY